MKSRCLSLPGAVALGVGMATIMPGLISTSMAQGLGQRGPTETITVVAEQQGGSLTAVTEAQARAALEEVPGGIGFVTAEDFLDGFAQSIGDTLVFTPGMFADTSATRENRISIRGSGLSATFERRGLTLLRDGVPITPTITSDILESITRDTVLTLLRETHGVAEVVRLTKANFSAPAESDLLGDAERWQALVAGVGD